MIQWRAADTGMGWQIKIEGKRPKVDGAFKRVAVVLDKPICCGDRRAAMAFIRAALS